MTQREVVLIGAALVGVSGETQPQRRAGAQNGRLGIENTTRFRREVGPVVREVHGCRERRTGLGKPPLACLAKARFPREGITPSRFGPRDRVAPRAVVSDGAI